ncbi:hypothetical protein [Chitinophaga nivalis]|uniref:Uncharacterized protein n=1 Tax=Chitinophaga nivalis TaxID=2991709 RepID=A0ABT3IKT6_9BACT|nr:hypothetical protein [Chitinophaga nivalis]MCW3465733.1 hypothetical protein [Chitinophaga nivalis]MCW3484576.1 hypothetical protein [Chitinophaga nivalis]
MRYHFRSALLLINALLFGACQKEQVYNQPAAATQATYTATARSSHPDEALTPGGWRPKSNVHRLAPGQYLDASNGRLRTRDRATRQVVSDYGLIEQNSVPSRQTQRLEEGWITSTRWTNKTGSPISYFSTKWTVPPVPKSSNGQTIFIFNGIVNSDAILQPVLQWGPSAGGGGEYWTIASWYVTRTGLAWYTDPVRVKPGTNLHGVITLTDSVGTDYCYTASFSGYPATAFDAQIIEELTLATEALEAYNVTVCSDYPATTKTRMHSIELKTDNKQAPLSWNVLDQVRDCGQYSKVVTNGTPKGVVDIFY